MRSLTFSPDLAHETLFSPMTVCAKGEPSRFVLPFFFAMPGRQDGTRERAAAGHLELPRCIDKASFHTLGTTVSGRHIDWDGLGLRLIAGGPLESISVRVLDPRTGKNIAQETVVSLLLPGDYARLRPPGS